jgi:hypothetical protein
MHVKFSVTRLKNCPILGKVAKTVAEAQNGQNIFTKLEDKEGVKVISSKVQCDHVEKLSNLVKNWPKQLLSPKMAKLSTSN